MLFVKNTSRLFASNLRGGAQCEYAGKAPGRPGVRGIISVFVEKRRGSPVVSCRGLLRGAGADCPPERVNNLEMIEIWKIADCLSERISRSMDR